MSGAVDVSPAVFICEECDQIIGDSFSLLEKDSDFIILRSALDDALIIGQTLHLLKDPYDGCTFLSVSCKKCKKELGCFIKSTSNEYDHYKNVFHLASSKLKEFQLGTVYTPKDAASQNGIKYDRLEQIENILLSYHHRLQSVESELRLLKQQRLSDRSTDDNSNCTPPHKT